MIVWAKVHSDILGDPKLMRAARKGYAGLELTPWLIVFAKAAKDGGRLTVNGEPAEPADLAPLIPCSTESSIIAALASLEAIGVLVPDEDGALRFATWEGRQAKPSDSREAVAERVQRHRAKQRGSTHEDAPDTPAPGDHVTPVTRIGALQGNATDVEGEEEREEATPQTPLRGAVAPVAVNGHRNGNGKHLTLHRNASRSLPVVLSGLTDFLAEVSQQTEREFHRDRLRDVMVDLVFAYWAKKTRHDGAKLDRKRAQLLRKRLVESEENVHQLLFAVDGALKDDVLMGRKVDSSRKYDGISTIYRDWEQVERLATQGGYHEGAAHAMAVKYLDGAMPSGASHGAVAAGN